MLILCLGGARSGKSTFALRLAFDHDAMIATRPGTGTESTDSAPVTFIATSPRIEGDVDLDERIATHRAERPSSWRTIEEPVDLIGALSASGDSFVIIDCLTLWVSNLMWRGDDDPAIVEAARQAAAAARGRNGGTAATVVISNEVGMGVHPTTDAGRRYRDVLGRVNQVWAEAADRALLLVAGRALTLHDPFREPVGDPRHESLDDSGSL